ncbi:SPOR domain-containing protein [Pseudomonas sp. GCM10022188]|uniref:SPOR domain-containing protein n=1 Tax=Pseudomonas TaxID=286 RepID=UPI001E3A88A7|nr:SPOR domain-containing protein [Pseudomonas oryzagri]MCC6076812.1 SPOR domain-containing protein [Pseudomonas oryzagri]
MALLDRRLKQRIVGAAVLLALLVVFLPMLFQREDEQRPVQVEAPPMPAMPAVAPAPAEPVAVPEPQAAEVPVEPTLAAPAPVNELPSQPIAAAAPPQAAPAPVPVASEPVTAAPSRLDTDGLPVSWTVQLASLSSRARAEELQNRLRKQGLAAYIRTVEGMSRVFVGPLIERGEAERVSAQIARQYKLSPIVVRFQPEGR